MNMPRILLLLATTFLTATTGYSQRVIQYRLTVFGTGNIKDGVYMNVPGDSKTKVEAIRGYVTNPIKATLRDETFLDFFEEGRKPEGDEPLKPDFTVTVPPGAGKELLVLLMQSGKSITTQLIDFKKVEMGKGDQMLFNTLSVPVALKYSDGDGEKWEKPILIKANSQKRISGPKESAVSREVAAKDPKTGKLVTISKGVYLKPAAGGREVTFCYMKKGSPLPVLETILIHEVPSS